MTGLLRRGTGDGLAQTKTNQKERKRKKNVSSLDWRVNSKKEEKKHFHESQKKAAQTKKKDKN